MTKRIQFIRLFITTFINKHKIHITVGILLGFFFAIFLFKTYPIYVKIIGSKTIRIGVIGKFNQNNLPNQILKQISLGLTNVSENGEAIPSLAIYWEVDSSGKSYIFHLRSNIVWHDGKKFRIEDINYNLKGAEFIKINEYSIKITLQEPFSPLPVLLSKPLIRENLIGVGDYKIVRVNYVGDNISELTLLPINNSKLTLIYKFYPSIREAILAFKLAEIDEIQEISDVKDIADWKNVQINESIQYDRFVGVFFNLKDPLFSEKEVRQALAYAIPKLENQKIAISPISPTSWAYSSNIKVYDYDPNGAKKILSKSRLATASTQLTISTFSPYLSTTQDVANAWKKIGVNTKIKVENSLTDNYQVFLLAMTTPPDPDQYLYWQSTQDSTNLTHYNNPKIDKLLEDGRKTTDIKARKKIYADFQRYLVDDAPVIFLYYPKVYNLERK